MYIKKVHLVWGNSKGGTRKIEVSGLEVPLKFSKSEISGGVQGGTQSTVIQYELRLAAHSRFGEHGQFTCAPAIKLCAPVMVFKIARRLIFIKRLHTVKP
jgi:hypothetical protein